MCGSCCGHEVLFSRGDLRRIESSHPNNGSLSWLLSQWGGPGAAISSLCAKGSGKAECVFLAGNLCSVHNSKPLLCRTYPFFPVPSSIIEEKLGPISGAVKVRSSRTTETYFISYDEDCPGVGRGHVQDWELVVRLWEQYEEEIELDQK